MMKIKNLMYVLMGTMLVATSCSDAELENGNGGSGTVDPVNASALVSVYADKNDLEASPLAGDVLVDGSRTLTLNVPAACEKVYMKYNTVSGTEAIKEFALSPVSRSADQGVGFNFETNRLASVTLTLPEDAVQPTDETDQGYLFYHNTGVVMFEDGWPTEQQAWYDEDFNDVVFEYDLKVTECHDQKQMDAQGGKEELLLTLDVRAVGGIFPTALGVVLEGLDKKFVDRVTASLVLKAGQGMMTDLAKKELSTDDVVTIEKRGWNWDDNRVNPNKERYAKLSVDKAQSEGTVIILDGLVDLKDNNTNMFQVVKGEILTGLPMLRAEIRLIGTEGLKDKEREAQLAAFRDLILDTNRQNFFIKVSDGKEIHMKGYAPTSAYKSDYDALVQGNASLDANVYYSNSKGSTWGVKVPVGTRHAYESIPFTKAYKDFSYWLENKGTTNKNWYEKFTDEKTVRYW